jgi:hypothetical protein
MGNAKLIGDGACVAYVLSSAARPCPFYGAPMIIKLQSDANGFRARARRERGHNRGINAARHGDDDPLTLKVRAKLEIIMIDIVGHAIAYLEASHRKCQFSG